MAIKDLQQNFVLFSEWNDLVNSTSQAVAWATMVQDKISLLTANVNFSTNASPEELQFVNSVQAQYLQFIQQQPVNPDK